MDFLSREDLRDRSSSQWGIGNRPAHDQDRSEKPSGNEAEVLDASTEEDREADVLLSVPLEGGTETEDGRSPLADENIEVGGDDGVEFPEGAVLAFPGEGNVNAEAGTISLEVEPNWNGDDEASNALVEVRRLNERGNIILFRNGEYLRFQIFDSEGQETDIGVRIPDWKAGDSHTVTATWGEALMSIYVDGTLQGQRTYSGEIQIAPGTPLFLGSRPDDPMVQGANGQLRNFKVYGHALSAEEIGAGLPGVTRDPAPGS